MLSRVLHQGIRYTSSRVLMVTSALIKSVVLGLGNISISFSRSVIFNPKELFVLFAENHVEKPSAGTAIHCSKAKLFVGKNYTLKRYPMRGASIGRATSLHSLVKMPHSTGAK